jgi:hypothetical protein
VDSIASVAIIVAIAALVAVAIGFAVWSAARRRRALQQFAAAHGLSFSSRGSPADTSFGLFNRGSGRRWTNVMSGTWSGVTVTYADYQYTVQSGKNSETYSFSTVMADIGCRIPVLNVGTRSMLGAFAEKTVGAPGLRFESVDFNDRFDVHADDQRFAYLLIDARMMETLLACPHGVHVTFGPDHALVWYTRQSAEKVSTALDAAAAIVQRIPDLVRHDYAAGSTPIRPA